MAHYKQRHGGQRLKPLRRAPSADSCAKQRSLKFKFGITMADYLAMLEAQGGVCAICGETCRSGRSLAVDHDHRSGRVRGLLCAGCNGGLGLLLDDAERVAAAARYLRNFGK